MNRLLSALAALALACQGPGAPVAPGDAGKAAEYQKRADAAPWHAPEKGGDFRRCLAHELTDFTVEVDRKPSEYWDVTIRVMDKGKEVYSWGGHLDSVFFVRDNVLYCAEYHYMSTGCAIVAFDLKARKRLWKADLKGLGPIDHSKYRNLVRLERVDDTVFAVYGQESAGRYVEFVEYKTGSTLGHKIFPQE